MSVSLSIGAPTWRRDIQPNDTWNNDTHPNVTYNNITKPSETYNNTHSIKSFIIRTFCPTTLGGMTLSLTTLRNNYTQRKDLG